MDKNDHSWRDALWATHEAVNKGAKVFGDWLLTLRGGLDHALADANVKGGKNTPDRAPTADERRDRRILLALSWLSVESAPKPGNPHAKFVVASGKDDTQSSRDQKVVAKLRDILEKRGVTGADLDTWISDCEPSLAAAIRDDAAWIDRSAAFDAARQHVGDSLTREVVRDMLEPFFGSHGDYLAPLKSEETTEDAPPTADKAKDLVQKAGQWLSSRFGTGKGADFNRMAKVYEAISNWAKDQDSFSSGNAALTSLATSLASFNPQSNDAEGILKLISGPGYKSATRNVITAWIDRDDSITQANLNELAEKAAGDKEASEAKTGDKGQRPYSNAVLSDVESACGFTYRVDQDGDHVPVERYGDYADDYSWGTARHENFAVMLDHAARRVSIGHSWIKRAEAERRKFTSDAEKLDDVPATAKAWLDEFCETRSGSSGALDAYRIRRRAVEGWKEVVARWSRADCKTDEDRIAAAREAQADPDIDKFGDTQLFEVLAADDALCVWQVNRKADAQPLLDYVAGTDAVAKQKRFKVPAYRHPDPLSHPVFCDFGNSRWDIRFAVHHARSQLADAHATVTRREKELRKAQERFDKAKTAEKQADAQGKLAKAQDDLKTAHGQVAWLSNQHVLSMGLWNGGSLNNRESLRWSCKRLTDDLGPRQASDLSEVVAVTRGDRLGRAAGGATEKSPVSILSVFDEKYWNGRLQAPREQLNAIAARLKKNNGQWDAKARDMRNRIRWLVSFSAKLQPTGPWLAFADEWESKLGSRYPIHNKRAENQKLRGRTRLVSWEWSSTEGDYIIELGSHAKPDSRGAAFPLINPTDLSKRSGHAKLILSRLPGLRVLSVDLGHRYAAACAVWEAITREAMFEACRKNGHAEPRESDLFIHLTRTVQKQVTKGHDKGKTKSVVATTIYRRISADTITDPKTGQVSPHPAPWARLDRQFLIKLPGEERSARAASNKGDADEFAMVAVFARRLGLSSDDERDKGRAVDQLMSRAVRIATLGLKRHARRAKIAYALDPATKSIPAMGGSEKTFTVGDEEHIKFLVNCLFDWHSLASDSKWNDQAARDLWNQHIATMTNDWRIEDPKPHDETAERPTRQRRRKDDDAQRQRLKPIAEQLSVADRSAMHAAWKERWEKDDGKKAKLPLKKADVKGPSKTVVEIPATGFHAELRWLTDWIMGKHLLGATSHGWKQNVGGLSVTRIATMKSLYQLHKAFAMRAKPDKPRGAPEKGETNAGVAQSILSAMERMREQRVKQLASRIAEAALGIGRIKTEHLKAGVKRPRQQVDQPCHAIVIENLTNYRPDELQTRRENRQLMAWSSSKVKKYLSEACQLHGLHLREVQAGYTSRQDSRTGAPGMRCADVPTKDFLAAPWWRRQVNRAHEKVGQNKGDARDRYLCEMDQKLNQIGEHDRPKSIRIPVNGGDLFVAAPPWSCRADGHRPCPLCDAGRAVQADLNAAANIGLRSLLDPDFPGKWWYVPAAMYNGWRIPAPKSCAGAACLHDWKVAPKDGYLASDGKPLTAADDETVKQAEEAVNAAKNAAKKPGADQTAVDPAKARHEQAKAMLKEAKKAVSQKEIVNIWQDPSAGRTSPSAGCWWETTAYWNSVKSRVIDKLRGQMNLNPSLGNDCNDAFES
ncbi:MAG: type V CRISPR-associated protein Cas12b [Planctomycetes bacterium]|nr:type V CRISPR-associated protein Cas12b [Planctomycetota bacterium]